MSAPSAIKSEHQEGQQNCSKEEDIPEHFWSSVMAADTITLSTGIIVKGND